MPSLAEAAKTSEKIFPIYLAVLPTEIDAIRRAMEPAEKEAAKERQDEARKRIGGGNFPQPTGKTRDKIGAFAGVSGRTVEKIAKVVEAAEQDPDKFGHLTAEMDRTGKVNGAYRKLKMADDEERVMSLKPVKGKFKTLVFDSPGDYEWLSLTDINIRGETTAPCLR